MATEFEKKSRRVIAKDTPAMLEFERVKEEASIEAAAARMGKSPEEIKALAKAAGTDPISWIKDNAPVPGAQKKPAERAAPAPRADKIARPTGYLEDIQRRVQSPGYDPVKNMAEALNVPPPPAKTVAAALKKKAPASGGLDSTRPPTPATSISKVEKKKSTKIANLNEVKASIGNLESAGAKDPYAATNSKSTSLGKYQFLMGSETPKNATFAQTGHRPAILALAKKMGLPEAADGFMSNAEFAGSRKLQEAYMDTATAEGSRQADSILKKNPELKGLISTDQLIASIHKRGFSPDSVEEIKQYVGVVPRTAAAAGGVQDIKTYLDKFNKDRAEQKRTRRADTVVGRGSGFSDDNIALLSKKLDIPKSAVRVRLANQDFAAKAVLMLSGDNIQTAPLTVPTRNSINVVAPPPVAEAVAKKELLDVPEEKPAPRVFVDRARGTISSAGDLGPVKIKDYENSKLTPDKLDKSLANNLRKKIPQLDMPLATEKGIASSVIEDVSQQTGVPHEKLTAVVEQLTQAAKDSGESVEQAAKAIKDPKLRGAVLLAATALGLGVAVGSSFMKKQNMPGITDAQEKRYQELIRRQRSK